MPPNAFLVVPPIPSAASSVIVRAPAIPARTDATRPAIPVPTTTTSAVSSSAVMSDPHDAAVDREGLAGHEGRGGRRQVRHGGHDVGDLSPALDRLPQLGHLEERRALGHLHD